MHVQHLMYDNQGAGKSGRSHATHAEVNYQNCDKLKYHIPNHYEKAHVEKDLQMAFNVKVLRYCHT